jgi:hypothetical protein
VIVPPQRGHLSAAGQKIALRHARPFSNHPDLKIGLFILDYNISGMDGCELADLLKLMCPELKIVPRHEMTSTDIFVSKADGVFRAHCGGLFSQKKGIALNSHRKTGCSENSGLPETWKLPSNPSRSLKGIHHADVLSAY